MSKPVITPQGDLKCESDQDFQSSQFWEGFFRDRNGEAFEWYGTWKELRALLLPHIRQQAVLVPGCGNSDLSAHLYDEGDCTSITNLDFSPLCIREMLRKNLAARPRMRWLVADMCATKFKAGDFGAVGDKGALDAVTAEGGGPAGPAFLREVQRLLAGPGATYLCVTLAQAHVLRLLLASFPGRQWHVGLERVPPSPDMRGHPLQPLLFVARRGGGGEGPRVNWDPAQVVAANQAQLRDVAAVVAEAAAAEGDLPQQDEQSQEEEPAEPSWAQLEPGRVVGAELRRAPSPDWRIAAHQGTQLASQAGGALVRPPGTDAHAPPRFSLAVVDLDAAQARAASHPCAVFIVPQGRENEWIFCAAEGQRQLAAQSGAARLVVVALGRGHAFPGTMQDLQAELRGLVKRFIPDSAAGGRKQVPFMTLGEGKGARRVIATARNGQVVVEDVCLPGDGDDYDSSGAKGPAHRWVRRLTFLAARSQIQSEARLVPPQPAPSPAGPANKTGKKHRPQPRGVACTGPQADTRAWRVDHTRLASDYYSAIVAGLSLAGAPPSWCSAPLPSAEPPLERGGRALVVGLGGGCLAAFLVRCLGLAVHVAELDADVIALAAAHFGVPRCEDQGGPGEPAESLTVREEDGLDAVAQGEAGSLDCLVVDANASDASLALSCPPAAFLGDSFLQNAWMALRPGGVLALNAVSRSPQAIQEAAAALQAVFPNTYSLAVDEDINVVLLAVKDHSPGSGTGAATVELLEERLRSLGLPGDSDAACYLPKLALSKPSTVERTQQ